MVSAGERVGLIGENGSVVDAGCCLGEPAGTDRRRGHGDDARGQRHLGLLHQLPPFDPDDTIADAVESAVAPVRKAERSLSLAADACGGARRA